MPFQKKYDIFISYRHEKGEIIEVLVDLLRRHYEVFWDQCLASGRWKDQLKQAMDNSRVVLVNFTERSLVKKRADEGEDWFYKEILYSIENKNCEEIIPIFHDGFSPPTSAEEIGADPAEMERFDNLFQNQQCIMGLKSLYSIVEKIIAYLSNLGIKPQRAFYREADEAYLVLPPITPTTAFRGRQEEIEEIARLVDTNNVVFLSGMGGIGKTELAKKVMEEATGAYQCVFCRYEDSLKSTLSKIQINSVTSEAFSDREAVLKKLLNKNVLLIIDNFDFEDDADIDEYMDELCTYECKKIITTRNTFADMEFDCKSAVMRIGALEDAELGALFEEKYGEKITNSQLKKILKFTGRLTLAVPILATLCVKSAMTVDALCEKIGEGLKGFEDSETIRYKKDGNQKGTVPEIMRVLFNLGDMDEAKKKTLCNLSLLQFMQVTRDAYREFAFFRSKGNLNAFNELLETNWIKENPGVMPSDSCFELHPVINELVKTDLKPSTATSPEVFACIKEKFFPAFDTKRKYFEAFLMHLDLQEKENADFLFQSLGSGEYCFEPNYTSDAEHKIVGVIADHLMQKEVFADLDVQVLTELLESAVFAEDYTLVQKMADKAFLSFNQGRITQSVMGEYVKEFGNAASFEQFFGADTLYRMLLEYGEKYPLAFSDNFFTELALDMDSSEEEYEKDEKNEAVMQEIADEIEQGFTFNEALIYIAARWEDIRDKTEVRWLFERTVFPLFMKPSMDAAEVKKMLSGVDAFCELEQFEAIREDLYQYFAKRYRKLGLACLSYAECLQCAECFGWDEAGTKLGAAMMYGSFTHFKEEADRLLYSVPVESKSADRVSEEKSVFWGPTLRFTRAESLGFVGLYIFEYVEKLYMHFIRRAEYWPALRTWYRMLTFTVLPEKIKKIVCQREKELEALHMGVSLKTEED